MTTCFTNRKAAPGILLACILAAAAALAAPSARAGECPADKIGANVLEGAATAPVGVTDAVLTSIDVSEEPVNLKDRLFRLRRLEIQPGGVVPLHSHGVRPALIYVISGEMSEYNTGCTVPIVHKAGEAAMESIGLSHWWKNTGNEVSVLISADLFPTKREDGHMM